MFMGCPGYGCHSCGYLEHSIEPGICCPPRACSLVEQASSKGTKNTHHQVVSSAVEESGGKPSSCKWKHTSRRSRGRRSRCRPSCCFMPMRPTGPSATMCTNCAMAGTFGFFPHPPNLPQISFGSILNRSTQKGILEDIVEPNQNGHIPSHHKDGWVDRASRGLGEQKSSEDIFNHLPNS